MERTELRRIIVYTQIGAVSATSYRIKGYDVDELASERTRSYMTRKQMQNIASTIDPDADPETFITSDQVGDY